MARGGYDKGNAELGGERERGATCKGGGVR